MLIFGSEGYKNAPYDPSTLNIDPVGPQLPPAALNTIDRRRGFSTHASQNRAGMDPCLAPIVLRVFNSGDLWQFRRFWQSQTTVSIFDQ
jgi:hypothetical protein